MPRPERRIIRFESSTAFSAGSFSADGVLFAAAGETAGTAIGIKPVTIGVWDATTGRKRHTLKGHGSRVIRLVFSPDKKRLVSCGSSPSGTDCEIRVWDMSSGKELAALNSPGAITSLAFEPDGNRLIGVRSFAPYSERPIAI